MSNFNTLLDQIDKLSEKEVELIVSALNGSNYDGDLFKKIDNILIRSSDDLVTLKSKIGGLYVFTVTNTVYVDIKDFNDVNKSTKLRHKKGLSTTCFKKGDTLYVGKSEDDLKDRITQHISLCEDSSTYSLKLSSEKRKFLLENGLMVSCFTIKTEYEKYKKIILPVIERYLHKELSPLVGSAKNS